MLCAGPGVGWSGNYYSIANFIIADSRFLNPVAFQLLCCLLCGHWRTCALSRLPQIRPADPRSSEMDLVQAGKLDPQSAPMIPAGGVNANCRQPRGGGFVCREQGPAIDGRFTFASGRREYLVDLGDVGCVAMAARSSHHQTTREPTGCCGWRLAWRP